MHNKSVQTHLMRTPEVLPVMEIDPRVEMHSKGSAENNKLTDINDSIYYVDNDILDFIDNAELAKFITNLLKGKDDKVTESSILSFFKIFERKCGSFLSFE